MSFKDKLNFGKKYEQIAKEQFLPEDEVVVDSPEGLFKAYDFKTNVSAYEVKSDRMAYKYGCQTMFIEYECNQKPSGINATSADYWLYFMVKPDGSYLLYEYPVAILKEACKTARTIIGGDGMRVKGHVVKVSPEYKLA